MRAVFALLSCALLADSACANPQFETQAPVAYLYDMQSGAVLFDRESTRRIPTASMAKMMTADVAFEAITKRDLKISHHYSVADSTWKKWNSVGSTMFLKSGESVSLDNLLHGLLTLSGNDAAIVIAEGLAGNEANFTTAMNAQAVRLRMQNSHFGTANGWPDGGKTYSTARDLTALAAHIINDHNTLFGAYFGQKSFRWGSVTQANRNPLLGAIPGADGMKTGHSDEAGYCLVGTVQRNGRRLVLVVAGLPTQQLRISEARSLAEWGFAAWDNTPLYKAGTPVGKVQIQGASENYLTVVAPHLLAVTQAKGTKAHYTFRIRYKGPVHVPIKKGDNIAQLVVQFADGKKQVMPLVAARSIGKSGFLGRAWAGLKSVAGQ